MSSQQTHPGQPDNEGGFPMVDLPVERNTGPVESWHHSASTPPTPQVAGASVSMGDSSLSHQVGASAPLGAELSSSQDKPGDVEPPVLQQERRPSFLGENQNATKDETCGDVSVRGPADLESGELDAVQTGGDEGASIAEKEVTQSKRSSEHATDTFSNQPQGGKGKGAKKKDDAAKSGKEHSSPPPGQSALSRNVSANSQNPKSLSPHESTTQKIAKDKSAQVSNAHNDYCSQASNAPAILRMDIRRY